MSNKEQKKNSVAQPLMEELEIGKTLYTTSLTKKFRNRETWSKPNEKLVEAVIPGTIQKIMVKEGQEVSAGTPVLILEAMKMRNEILAPVTGVVPKIHVKEGEHVPKAHLLFEMD